MSDKKVKHLIDGIKNGRVVDHCYSFGIDQTEFTLQDNCLLRGIRVYIPPCLRIRVLNELHSAHFGMTRMKSLARAYCWWTNIDQDIEEMVKNCSDCQLHKDNPMKVPIHTWEAPKAPFQRVHVDFAGPFLNKYFLIYVDAYSKWPEVHILSNITTTTTIGHLRQIFSAHGIPCILVTDRGSQFTSLEFQEFLQNNGIVHRMGAPYHPSTNGQAERTVQTIKSKLGTLKCEQGSLEKELCNILLIYRKTLHPSTGKSPSMIVYGRQIRSRIDLMIPQSIAGEEVSVSNKKIKNFNLGQRVACREYLDKQCKWKFGTVIQKIGLLHYLIELDDGRNWKRHVDQMNSIGKDVRDDRDNIEDTVIDNSAASSVLVDTTGNEISRENNNDKTATVEDILIKNSVSQSPVKASTSNTDSNIENMIPEPRRSNRIRKPPVKLNI